MTSRATLAHLEPCRMVSADSGHDLVGRNATLWISLHGIVNRDYFLAQPSLNRCVTLLQGAQARAYHFTRRGIGAGGDQGIDVCRLLGRQAERAFLGRGHDQTSLS